MGLGRLSWAFLVDSVPFTPDVIAGRTSLGGSESACLGLARALTTRGHDVHIFTTQLADGAAGRDHAGVMWHGYDEFRPMNAFIEWDVVVSLRMFSAFAEGPIHARMRLLWSQDLLVPGPMQMGVMAIAWALDHVVYVSDYHRRQWEQLQPELAGLGWATTNSYDPSDLPREPVAKVPTRIIHVSRPERGLGPLLAMWPALKAQVPEAELHLCRYSSMYDQGPGSWSDVCASWDAQVHAVNDAVGGITYLGELTKPALYQAISEAAVLWYPGVSTFAETSCIAAIEAQACGTPFVGSYRGALPETVPGGVLVRGVAESDPAYQAESIAAVVGLLRDCGRQARRYRQLQSRGRAHVVSYTHDAVAARWEAQVTDWFKARAETQAAGVRRQLLHEDDHVAARQWALERGDAATVDWCDYVIAGKDQTAEQYGNAALPDPLLEVELSDRFRAVVPEFAASTSVLDVACGNGSFAIALALSSPTVHVVGVDYAESNIVRAREAAAKAGVADRCTFARLTAYDFDAQDLHPEMQDFLATHAGAHDGLFVGEFIEHVAAYRALIDGLEQALQPGATVVYTCPHGACAEMLPRGVPLRRGHVHRFHWDDLSAVWGPKQDFRSTYLGSGITERGNPLGNWIIRYTYAPGRPCGRRPIEARITKTRPMPTLTVGLITKDAEADLVRCLESVYRIADELIVGDTGSTDGTVKIAQLYRARVLELPSVMDIRDGFSGARNAVLERATGEWFLWIDADEQLINTPFLRRYLDGHVYNGYVVRQTHVYLDGPPTQDIPVRLFRHTGRVRFYGCIHEQPQDGDPNADIVPTLDVGDLTVAHTGYLTEARREDKRVFRNRPLLIRDQEVFPARTLGKVLCLREAVIESDRSRMAAGGLTQRAAQGYRFAVQMFETHFSDPAHKYHQLARPWYEAALQHLGIGWEIETSMAGRRGGLGATKAKPERLWVQSAEEAARVLTYRRERDLAKMAPVTFITDPDVLRPVAAPEQVAV